MSKYSIFKPEELSDFARRLRRKIETDFGNPNKAVVVGLVGNLGAGKTAFTKAFAKELNIDEDVTSPTFVLLRRYDLREVEAWRHFYHLDLYRLSNSDEMKPLKWDEIIEGPENLIFVEWPERIPEVMSRVDILIKFETVSEYERVIEVPFDM